MKVYGVVNHSPEQTAKWLNEKNKVSFDEIYILPIGKTLPESPDKKIKQLIFVLTPRDLNRNLPTLNTQAYEDRHVFLFASPVRVSEYDNVTWLDMEESQNNPTYGLTLRRSFLPLFNKKDASGQEVKMPDRRYLTKVIENLKKTGALLTPMMTAIYTLPNATHQTPVKRLFCNWIYYGGDEKALDRIFSKIQTEIPIGDKIQNRFRNLLLSDVGQSYKDAFSDLRKQKTEGKPVQYPALAKRYNVSAYEMRYIGSVVRQAEEYTKFEKITIQELLTLMKKNKEAKKIAEADKKEKKAKADAKELAKVEKAKQKKSVVDARKSKKTKDVTVAV